MMMNPYLSTIVWWAVFFVLMVIAVWIFVLVTPFKLRKETEEKNGALGAALAGLLIGIAIIIFAAMATSASILTAISYSVLGFALMLISYFIYDLITPEKISQEIDDHNMLVGLKIAGLFIAVSLVVGGALL